MFVKPSETGFAEWTSPAWEPQIRSSHQTWKPSDDIREERIQSKVRERCLEDARDLVPDEKEMRRLEDLRLDSLPDKPARGRYLLDQINSPLRAANPVALMHTRLEKLGVAVGDPSGEDLVIEAGLSWKTRRTNPVNCATKRDFSEMGWPLTANPVRWVTYEEEQEIEKRFANAGLTLPGSPAPLTTKSLADIMRHPPAPDVWLIKDILRRGAPMMIYGPTGVGKSWLTHTITLMLAQGGHFSIADGLLECGSPPVRVLVIDGEMVIRDFYSRTLQLSDYYDSAYPNRESSPWSRVQVAARSDQDPETVFVDLANPLWKIIIVNEVIKGGYGLVVLDNLSTLAPTLEDENDAVAWNPLNSLLVALKKINVASLVVHHTGKAKDFKKVRASWRGSSNLGTPLETIIGLGVVNGEKFHGTRFKVYVDKARNENEIALDGRIIQLEAGSGIWESEIDALGDCEKILEMILSHRYPLKQDLAAELGYTPPELSRILAAICEQGFDAFKNFKPLTNGETPEDAIKRHFREAKKLKNAIAKAGDDKASVTKWMAEEPDVDVPNGEVNPILLNLNLG